jgi:hypothetical protein
VFYIRISRQIAEVMALLEMRLFQVPATFLPDLAAVKNRPQDRPPAILNQRTEDRFAPGTDLLILHFA